MNEHQRKMARKSKKMAGYRDGGLILKRAEQLDIEAADERKAYKTLRPLDPATEPVKSLRDVINSDLPPKSGKPPVRMDKNPNRFVRG